MTQGIQARPARQGTAPKTITRTPGLCAGTHVLTARGEVPVEGLAAGDRIITRDAGMKAVQAVRHRSARFAPVRVTGGALGHSRPEQDTMLAPDTQVLIRDWRAKALFGRKSALVAAERLVDGKIISRAATQEVQLVELVFDGPHVVYADGLEIAVSQG